MEAYKARMMTEYNELAGRLDRLTKLLADWDMGKLDFQPSCPYDLLRRQEAAMSEYKVILRERARIEGIPSSALSD